MNSKEKRKIFLLIIGMLVAIVGFGYIMTIVEKHMPEEKNIDAGFLQDADTIVEQEPAGYIKLQGEIYDYYHEFETYLFMGTDASGSDDPDNYQGSMSDFLLLVVLDKTDQTYQFLPINRDTMTEIILLQKDGTGVATADLQICTAHWYGGNAEQSCENTVKAVSKLLGKIPIDGYYCLPMEKIPQLNRAVGGVEVTLLEDFTEVDQGMKKGNAIILSDEQAYHYIHDRYGVGNEENVSRMKRQQQYLKALLKKAKSRMKEDKTFLNSLFNQLQESATTDMTGKTVSRLAAEVSKGTQKEFCELEGKFKLGQALGDGIDHVEFYVDNDSLVKVMTELYSLKKRNGE